MKREEDARPATFGAATVVPLCPAVVSSVIDVEGMLAIAEGQGKRNRKPSQLCFLRRVTRGRTGATESEHEEEESTDVLSDGGDEVFDE